MIRVRFRDASKDAKRDSSLLADPRLMVAVPPIQARVQFTRTNFEDSVGRVVDHIWHISHENPNDVAVDVIVSLE